MESKDDIVGFLETNVLLDMYPDILSNEKVLTKLGKISSDSGRVGNYLNERRRNYGRKFMYKWKEL